MHDRILTVPYRTVPARRLIRHLEAPAGFALAGIPERLPQRINVLANLFKAYHPNIVKVFARCAVVRRIWDNAILSNPTKD